MEAINQEIKKLFNDADFRKAFIMKQIHKNYIIDDGRYFMYKERKDRAWWLTQGILFSPKTRIKNGEICYNVKMPLEYKRRQLEKCGIEIIHEIGSKKYDKNGKCVFKYHSNTELKEMCKMNKIKGYSKMKKLELISALMKI